ncbi:MAG: GNAT family N-acetyltransferase [Cecembia sp.]
MEKDFVIEKVSSTLAPIELLLLADPSRELIEQYLSESSIFLASSKGKTKGIIALYPIEESILEIKNLAVVPSFQKKGLGKNLILFAENFAKANGYTKLRICTGNTSFHQLALYQKLGFQKKDKILNFFLEQYPEPIFENGMQCKDLIVLEKELI